VSRSVNPGRLEQVLKEPLKIALEYKNGKNLAVGDIQQKKLKVSGFEPPTSALRSQKID